MLADYPVAQHMLLAYFLMQLRCKDGATLWNAQLAKTNEPMVCLIAINLNIV
jgi:hypothetical protein